MIEFILGFYVGIFVMCCFSISKSNKIIILEGNWNKLKSYISKVIEIYDNVDVKTLEIVKNEIEEIERGKDI